MELILTLHTVNGPVVSCYPASQVAAALEAFAQYVADGKVATLAHA